MFLFEGMMNADSFNQLAESYRYVRDSEYHQDEQGPMSIRFGK